MSSDMEKLAAFSEDQESTHKSVISKTQDDTPVDLKVNDVITVNSMKQKVQKTLQGKLDAVSKQLAVMNESILKAKEDVMELENILNELHEKFTSKISVRDNTTDS